MVVAISSPTWLQTATTAAAALAAVASCVAVLQSRRALKDARLPLLHAEASVIGTSGPHARPTTMAITIINGGGGLAKGLTFVLVAGEGYGVGHVSFLLPGQQAHFGIQIPGAKDARGVVFCRDQDEESYGWSLAGKKQHFKRSKHKPFHTAMEIFAHFYPDTDFGALSEGATLQASHGFPAPE
jgi:hypothetical protein